MRGYRAGRRGGRGSLLWRVLRRPLKLFGFGSRRGRRPQVEGEGLLRLAAFQRLRLRMPGQGRGSWSVLFWVRSVTAAGASTAQEELNFTAMLA